MFWQRYIHALYDKQDEILRLDRAYRRIAAIILEKEDQKLAEIREKIAMTEQEERECKHPTGFMYRLHEDTPIFYKVCDRCWKHFDVVDKTRQKKGARNDSD